MSESSIEKILKARRGLVDGVQTIERGPDAAEGGCGVVGLASNIGIAGQHVLNASRQMHNRGNGKGGGIAMAGLDPTEMRVDGKTLRTHTLLQIALLDREARAEVEAQFIAPNFDIAAAYEVDHVADWREVEGLDARPPDVWRYFVRVKPDVLAAFAAEKDLVDLPLRAVEDEFIYQNSFRLNQTFYASLGDKRAFVLCHGRDLIVLKIVGYAEQVVEYYRLGDLHARVWIAHQRYPTKGRVWHPGGAHPFVGLNEALVHNGDFANYHAVSEYLRQRNMAPLFLTDTEVAAQLFDLWDRVHQYPLEITLEAMAPTTEHDFTMLAPERQATYRAVQAAHIHGSPDGPWFFIVARSDPDENRTELIGITDTSMLRPQVFALYEHDACEDGSTVQIGIVASERQAINACLESLSEEDGRFRPTADRYWNARGGSHTDGGAFRFSFTPDTGLVCTNKFSEAVNLPRDQHHYRPAEIDPAQASDVFRSAWQERAYYAFDDGGAPTFRGWLHAEMSDATWAEVNWGLNWLREFSHHGADEWSFALQVLSDLSDRPFDPGSKRLASLRALVDGTIRTMLNDVPAFGASAPHVRLDWANRHQLDSPTLEQHTLVLDCTDFPPEGDEAAARCIVSAYRCRWRHIIAYNWHGGRFAACGLGAQSEGLRLDLYFNVGDYTASGLDGAEVHLHGDGQDQLGQIMRRGKLVIHGDVGQTFLYGAKGGEVYVRGSAAGRPLINAVGKPRVVINGTCLDYLAESFMAGDPLNGGGFVILNGVEFAENGTLRDLPLPYPGGNLFSLASGGAIYLRDPHYKVMDDQLNGGAFQELTERDWALIEPYLIENERLFSVRVDDLLTVDGQRRTPRLVYRKVAVAPSDTVLRETDNR